MGRRAASQLVDGSGGPLRIAGVNRSGSECACAQGWGMLWWRPVPDPTTAAPRQPTARHTGRSRVTIGSWGSFFWSAVLGGWALALVAWLIQSTAAVIGQVALIWALAFVVGVVGLDHCVSTTMEVLCATLGSDVHVGRALYWLVTVILGNILGGVLIVAVVNYGQVRGGED